MLSNNIYFIKNWNLKYCGRCRKK